MCLLLLLRNDSREIYSLCKSGMRKGRERERETGMKTFWPRASEHICVGKIDVASIWLQFHVLSALSPEGCLRACYGSNNINNNKETELFVQ